MGSMPFLHQVDGAENFVFIKYESYIWDMLLLARTLMKEHKLIITVIIVKYTK